jgi:hypothetical protein
MFLERLEAEYAQSSRIWADVLARVGAADGTAI